MDKQRLRDKYRKIRLNMSPRDIENDSLYICRFLFKEIDWDKTKRICVYKPIVSLKEVDISSFTDAVNYKYPDIKIRKLGISKRTKIPKSKFDVIIVPCLAYDKDNYRLGWGGGFYDRFLAGQSQAIKIGVCFSNGFAKKGLPHNPHDIKLDMVISEK